MHNEKYDDHNNKDNTGKNNNRLCLLSADWNTASKGKENNVSTRDRTWDKSNFNEKNWVIGVLSLMWLNAILKEKPLDTRNRIKWEIKYNLS